MDSISAQMESDQAWTKNRLDDLGESDCKKRKVVIWILKIEKKTSRFFVTYKYYISEHHMGRQVDLLQASIQSQLEGVNNETLLNIWLENCFKKCFEKSKSVIKA